jgi:hypothetical protein
MTVWNASNNMIYIRVFRRGTVKRETMKSDETDKTGERQKECLLLDKYCEIGEFSRWVVTIVFDNVWQSDMTICCICSYSFS